MLSTKCTYRDFCEEVAEDKEAIEKQQNRYDDVNVYGYGDVANEGRK